MRAWSKRLTLGLACALCLSPFLLRPAPSRAAREKPATFQGKVVRLAEVLAQKGTRLDADAAPYWLALAGEDGKIYPLIKDGGSRLFFKDPALLNRPMRLTGHLVPNSQLLLVTSAHSLI